MRFINLFFYVLGSFLYFVFLILFNVFKSNQDGRNYELNGPVLLDLAIRASIAGISFLIVDYLLSKRK